MNRETRQRIEIAKKKIREMPEIKERDVKPRTQYKWGVKQYLSSFNIGEIKEFNEDFHWKSVRSIAARMAREFGCMFLFSTKFGKRYITRLK